jgi:aspartate-semialdehyde dehydrogenase
MIARLLDPIHRAIGVTRASTFVLRPASDFGEPGLEELREQTVHLLRFEPTPSDVFGRQLAFNVVPEHLFPSGEDEAGTRVVREVRAILRAPELSLAVSQALVPAFYGHAIAAHVEVARAGSAEALAAWRAAPGIEVASDPEVGATLDAPDRPGLLIARVDAEPGATLRFWALASEAGPAAAADAIEAAAAAGVL